MTHPQHRRRLRHHADAIAIEDSPEIVFEQHVFQQMKLAFVDPLALCFAEHMDAAAARLLPLLAAPAAIALAQG